MKTEIYPITTSQSNVVFEFVSIGTKGKIKKQIRYDKTHTENIWNLAFGDIDEETNEINDKIVSGNGDTDKVLATVVETVIDFTNNYPERLVYAEGSSRSRTRIYQIGINKSLKDIEKDFIVWGRIKNDWEEFKINKNYEAFLVKKKKYI